MPHGRHALNISLPPNTDPLRIESADFCLSSEFMPPVCEPRAPDLDGWAHLERNGDDYTLGGHAGQLTTDVFSAAGMELHRDVWIDRDGQVVALRVKAINRNTFPLRLRALYPLQCCGPGGLTIGGKGVDEWEAVSQDRYKNGVPTAVRPATFDDDYAHAVALLSELGKEQGTDGRSIGFESDSFCVVRRRGSREQVLFGFVSQFGHLARINLKTDGTRRALDTFAAESEFDECLLPPGGMRSSQWVCIIPGEDAGKLIAGFADWVGNYHGVKPPPGNPPSVYCTWQFYGINFGEAELIEALDHFRDEREPFDVFLIDGSWAPMWGDWQGKDGWDMRDAAGRIRALGYRPAIWTAPFLAKTNASIAREHPEWLLRKRDGTLCIFKMDGENYVFDPTYPGVLDHYVELFRRLTFDWGFTYHKLDFLRCVFMEKDVKFHNPGVTRLEAYRMGLEAVRRGMGPQAYLSVCGGHYGGSLGLADSQRSGSDVASMWDEPAALPKLKQNIMRTWMGRLWHVDPDAMVVRRRETPINDTLYGYLSLGKFNDDEARTIALNQYVGGGMVCFSEKFSEIDDDRRSLYRHVIPSVNSAGVPLDHFSECCPSMLRTAVEPRCGALEPWVTIAIFNWADEARDRELVLSDRVTEGLDADRFLLFDFFDQKVIGLFGPGDTVKLAGLPPHGCRQVKVMPWRAAACFVGTDLHFSSGGVEVTDVSADVDSVSGSVETDWKYPVRVTAAFPDGDECVTAGTTVAGGEQLFAIARHAT